MSEKKIKMGIQDGDEFFAHEMSINFNPMQFIFDFRSVTPRTDPRTKEGQYFALKHNVVMVDAYHAKRIHEVLGGMLEEYEKQFGKIDKPKAVKAQEKKMKKQNKEVKKENTMPSYFG